MPQDIIQKVLDTFKQQTGHEVREVDLRTEHTGDRKLALFAKVRNKEHHAFILFDPESGDIGDWGWVIPVDSKNRKSLE